MANVSIPTTLEEIEGLAGAAAIRIAMEHVEPVQLIAITTNDGRELTRLDQIKQLYKDEVFVGACKLHIATELGLH